MDFKRISHFVAVAEAESISKAAERMHIVQPAISQSIKKLEEEMGAQLFTRSRRGMELTESGTMFLKYAYGILNQFNRAKESVSAVGKKPTGLVSVAMTASALNVLSVPICTLMQNAYPDIQLNLEEGLSGNIQKGFEAGWYDLMITFDPEPNESVHIEELIIEDLYLVTPYKADSPKEVVFSDLKNFPIIIPQDQDSIGQTLNKHAEKLSLDITSSMITAALHPALLLIEAGLGNTILPWSAIFDRVELKNVSARKIKSPSIRRCVSMIYPTQRTLTQASIAVMEIIRSAVLSAYKNNNWHGELLIEHDS